MSYCGIRARLLFLALIPAAAVAVGMLVLLVNARLARFNNELHSEAQLIARQWAPAIERAVHRNDRHMLRNISQAAIQSSRVDRFRVLDQQGRILVDSRQRGATNTLVAFASYLLHGLTAGRQLQPATAVLPLRSAGLAGASLRPVSSTPLGTLEIEMPVSDVLRAQLTALTFPGLLALAVLLCAALAALIIASTLLSPMRRLTHQVQKLEHDSLQSWTPSGCQGQLGQLETAIGAMIWALRHRQYRLEERVRRTASELRQTLRALEVQNAELDVARRRALEASTIKSQFLANVSHEIRTPINGIVGFTELLRHTPLDAEQREHVDTIKVSCANLLTLINDILDVSKIEAGKLEIDSMAFDPRDSVEEVLALLAPTAYSKGLELTQVVCADIPPRLNGDPTRIRQILTNLVHNAIKFTPQGHVVVQVILDEQSATDATLRITISDTGVGLSDEDRSKLFRAFGQAGDSPGRHFAGTGLGLIISKKLVEQMGGTIGLESEPQQGSTFWFTLCLQKPRSAPTAAVTGLSPLLGRPILLLDDEPLSQEATRTLLAPWGVELRVAENEADFLERLDREAPWDAAIVSVARKALRRELSKALVRRCVKADVPLMILASTVERAQLRRFCKNGVGTALPKTSRRQTILRELCRLIGAPSPLAPRAIAHDVSALGGDSETSSAPPLRVLVVDDNEINRKLVRCIAAQHGAWVDEACNGLEAMARCQERDYDVIFMDILMPRLGGEQAAQRIHELYPGERAPEIVALTANAMPGERQRLLAGGMDECLIKPITEEQVVRCLRRRRTDQPPVNRASTATGGAAAAENPLAAELTQMFRVELPEHRGRIRDAYRREDMPELREHVHRLHGAASICRLTPLKSACRALEDALIKGKRRAITAGMKRLLTEIARQQRADRAPSRPISV